jgi:hypothetical protein
VNADGMLAAADVTTGAAFRVNATRTLFKFLTPGSEATIAFAPIADGKRLLALVPQAQGESTFRVVLNWPGLIR